MNKLKEQELFEVNGGASGVSGAILTALKGVGGFIYNIGQALGSSIRRIAGGKYCSL